MNPPKSTMKPEIYLALGGREKGGGVGSLQEPVIEGARTQEPILQMLRPHKIELFIFLTLLPLDEKQCWGNQFIWIEYTRSNWA